MRRSVSLWASLILIVGVGVGVYFWKSPVGHLVAAPEVAEHLKNAATQPPSYLGRSFAVSASGWLTAFLLAALLLFVFRRWRIAFETQTFLMLPSSQADLLKRSLEDVVATLHQLNKATGQQTSRFSSALTEIGGVVSNTRNEFLILREDLVTKSEEIKSLRLGQEFLHQRSVLLRMVRALEIIDDDGRHDRDPAKTLTGVRIELEECLEDCGVVAVSPPIGEPVSKASHVDSRMMMYVGSRDPSKYGLVASVESPAYVYRSPNGGEAMLTPSRISVFVEELETSIGVK